MIISASRRTDIPAFYAEWLLHRLEAGYALSRNPFNAAQQKRISLLPEDVDCLVLWTKDPANLIERLSEIEALLPRFYFQFTLTAYDRRLEPYLRPKNEIIDSFVALGKRLDRNRLVWRYDPIVLNEELNTAWHEQHFEELCQILAPATDMVTISFVDLYPRLTSPWLQPIAQEHMMETAAALQRIAARQGLRISACCEATDFSPLGIEKAACIDRRRVEAICGYPLSLKTDPHQRPGCGCLQSVDIGAYNTCGHGCLYCYANRGRASTLARMKKHDPHAELLMP